MRDHLVRYVEKLASTRYDREVLNAAQWKGLSPINVAEAQQEFNMLTPSKAVAAKLKAVDEYPILNRFGGVYSKESIGASKKTFRKIHADVYKSTEPESIGSRLVDYRNKKADYPLAYAKGPRAYNKPFGQLLADRAEKAIVNSIGKVR